MESLPNQQDLSDELSNEAQSSATSSNEAQSSATSSNRPKPSNSDHSFSIKKKSPKTAWFIKLENLVPSTHEELELEFTALMNQIQPNSNPALEPIFNSDSPQEIRSKKLCNWIKVNEQDEIEMNTKRIITLHQHYILYTLFSEYKETYLQDPNVQNLSEKQQITGILNLMKKDLNDKKTHKALSESIRNADRVYAILQLTGWKCIYKCQIINITAIRSVSSSLWPSILKEIELKSKNNQIQNIIPNQLENTI